MTVARSDLLHTRGLRFLLPAAEFGVEGTATATPRRNR